MPKETKFGDKDIAKGRAIVAALTKLEPQQSSLPGPIASMYSVTAVPASTSTLIHRVSGIPRVARSGS